MRTQWIWLVTAALALSACGEKRDAVVAPSDSGSGIEKAPMAAEADAEEAAADAAPKADDSKAERGGKPISDLDPEAGTATAPQIAYTYALGFRLPTAAIKPLQEKHADLCEARGPKVCRIISMEQSEEDGDYAYGTLQLAVAADRARAFGRELEGSSRAANAELTSSSIQGEDLSKQIVDTEAKLRARILLRDRLMDILRNRQGSVAELVEAERGVAQVNEEIDQAQSWLTEMRGRVAFSAMTIRYESGSPSAGGFIEPIRGAWNSLGGILGGLVAFLIVVGAVLIPLGLLGWGLWRLFRLVRPSAQRAAPIMQDALEVPSEA